MFICGLFALKDSTKTTIKFYNSPETCHDFLRQTKSIFWLPLNKEVLDSLNKKSRTIEYPKKKKDKSNKSLLYLFVEPIGDWKYSTINFITHYMFLLPVLFFIFFGFFFIHPIKINTNLCESKCFIQTSEK